ncbi:MAG: hypothetical protein CL927_12465, partial [Deltaproteobacteria bacterium]|nr:hypothetical protein [Deltaproteobacteria bacterium]
SIRALEALIERLDGLPLALELAAARLRIMGVEGVLHRLEDRFRLLRSRDGTIDPRKADLRTVLESSWHQLDPRSRLGLAHCSVFRGAFTLEAAEAVIDLSHWPDDLGAWDVLETLEDHSLLEVVGPTRARPHFRLLHSVRDLAHGFLSTSGAVVDPSGADQTGPAAVESARARHAAHFARLGSATALFRLQTSEGPEVLKRLYSNLDEMVSALAWAVSSSSIKHASPLADAVLEVASNRGPPNLAEGWIDQLLAIKALPIADAVRISARRGRIRSNQGAWDAARGELEATLQRAREHGSLEDVARIREALGEIEIAAGNLKVARAHLEQTLGWEHHSGDASVGLLAMVGLGQISQMEGDIEEASAKFNAALQSIRRAGHRRMEAMLQCHIGSLDQERGRLARALQRYTQALDIAQEIGSRIVELTARGNVAGVLVDLGRQE